MLGALLTVGTFDSSVLFVAAILIIWAVWESRRELPPVPGLILAGSIAFTAPLATVAWHPLVISALVLAIVVLGRSIRRQWDSQSFFLGLIAGVTPQIVAAFFTWPSNRPGLLSLNASQVAQTGLVFWLILPSLVPSSQRFAWVAAAIQMSVAVSRAPMAVGFVYVVLNPSRLRLLMFAGICVLFAGALISQGLGDRLNPGELREAAQTRSDLIKPSAETETGESKPVFIPVELPTGQIVIEATTDSSKYNLPRFTWTGYGNGNYLDATGIVRPHNVPVLLFYEMGLLALVPFGLFGWAAVTRRIPWGVAFSLFLLWQVVEEPAGRFEGMFTTAAVLIALWQRPLPLSDLARYARVPLRKVA